MSWNLVVQVNIPHRDGGESGSGSSRRYRLPGLFQPAQIHLVSCDLASDGVVCDGAAQIERKYRKLTKDICTDPDTVGEFVQTKVRGAGLDGICANLPANGHDLERITLAGETLRKALG